MANRTELSFMFFNCTFAMDGGTCVCGAERVSDILDCKETVKAMKKKVSSLGRNEVDLTLRHLTSYMVEMCTSRLGNYLAQTIITNASYKAVSNFVNQLDIEDVVYNKHGSRVVQVLAEVHDGRHSSRLLRKMKSNFLAIALHPRGNYALKDVCQRVQQRDLGMLIELSEPVATKMACDQHGAYVQQAIVEKLDANVQGLSEADHSRFGVMLSSIVCMGPQLILDAHGNYTAQKLIPVLQEYPDVAADFVGDICNNIVWYADSKVGSRVVEEVLEVGHEEAKKSIVECIGDLGDAGWSALRRTEYGSFVVDKAVDVASGEGKKKLMGLLKQD